MRKKRMLVILMMSALSLQACHRDNPPSIPPPSPQTAFTLVQAAIHWRSEGFEEPAEALGLDLSGFNWAQVIDLGERTAPCGERRAPHLTAILVSRNHDGDLLTFGPEGDFLSHEEIPEPVTYQPYDLDGDGLAELLVDEVDDWGTGIYIRFYNLYQFSDDGSAEEVWTDRSFWSIDLIDREFGQSSLGFRRIWGQPGDEVIYRSDGIANGKRIHIRDAISLEDGAVTIRPLRAEN